MLYESILDHSLLIQWQTSSSVEDYPTENAQWAIPDEQFPFDADGRRKVALLSMA
jgi:hypothetical protein